jgi:hypothetical protein
VENNARKEFVHRSAEERAQVMAARDPLFSPWADATVGEPIVVRTVSGRPSYWLVPMELAGRAIGFVRVSVEGRALAAGALYRDPARPELAPSVVTGITATEARSRVAEAIGQGALAGDPVYVHDGPPGREAWMVPVQQPDGVSKVLFVTAAGWYERSPDELTGQLHDREG